MYIVELGILKSAIWQIQLQKVNFINGNMKSVIKKYEFDTSVAFAHCISADFGNVKHQMSAGVGTTFKEHFGKPKISDCLNNSNLTYQKYKDGSLVYGPITKEKYFHKPTEDSYNIAFQKLL